MEYTSKLIYQSNYWYNDGLAKAKIRDTSGAIVSLKKSLSYHRENIAARNLLGLVYYSRGEVAEALVEWIISKNFQSHENIATYYIQKVQGSPNELEAMNMAIKKYNQCLQYCKQGGEDLALIQLKQIVAAQPTFLKAHLLLALLYIRTEQYARARQILKKARKLDTTNRMTLRYIHELSKLSHRRGATLKEGKPQAITFQNDNETIIQPVSGGIKDNGIVATFLNILIGLIVGAAVVWFLVVPEANEQQAHKLNREVVKYSNQIAAKDAEVSALKKELDAYKVSKEEVKEQQQIAKATMSSYEALMTVQEHRRSGQYSNESMAKELVKIQKKSLGEDGKKLYEELYNAIVPSVCQRKYNSGLTSYEVENYDLAVQALELVTSLDEKYEDGKALLALAKAYDKTTSTAKAKKTYERVIALYPDTDLSKEAEKWLEDKK